MKKFLGITSGMVAIFLMLGCATVNVYVTFPEKEIKNAATDIEDSLGGGGERGRLRQPLRQPLNFNPFSTLLYAETISPELKIYTPEIKAALASRKKRFRLINEYKSKGVIGENNKALVQIRGVATSSVQRLVREENKDRMTIYQALVRQNNMPSGQLTIVQDQFAAVHREKANRGEWIQLPNNNWIKK